MMSIPLPVSVWSFLVHCVFTICHCYSAHLLHPLISAQVFNIILDDCIRFMYMIRLIQAGCTAVVLASILAKLEAKALLITPRNENVWGMRF